MTLPKPMTSGAKSEGRFGKQDFVYLPTEDVYRCPAGEKLTYRFTREEDGLADRQRGNPQLLVPAALGKFAPSQYAKRRAARQRPPQDAEIPAKKFHWCPPLA